jgi:hypothetical protein
LNQRVLKAATLVALCALALPLCGAAADAKSAAASLPALLDATPARGFYDAPIEVRLETRVAGAQIRFTLDGTEPTAGRSQSYTAPVRVEHPTVLRAAVFEGSRRISAIATHTYLFLADVLQQAKEQRGLPNGPRAWNGFPAAYAMDPRVVHDPAYELRMVPALRALPTVSMVCAPPDLFGRRGIYLNSTERGDDWERGCSIEWITADGKAGFQVDCGVQIQGNQNRVPEKSPKHSFRLVFKDQYGPGKLKFPLFPDSPVESFNTLILRGGYNNTWLHSQPAQRERAQTNRDGWLKDSFRAMGWLTTHDRYVHLYLNGLYWGLYDVSERPDGAFAAAYIGGKKEDYDVINESDVKGGTRDAFVRLEGSRGLTDPARYMAVQSQLEMTRFIDYLLLNYYAGNQDWGEDKNWYAVRRREPPGPFLFFVWDGEHIFEHLTDDTIKRPFETPLRIASALWPSAEFRLAFADRVQKHCFNGGALTPESAAARWVARSRQIDLPIIAESARWGYYRGATPFTRNENWLPEQRRLLTEYFPKRTGVLLQQLRSIGLFPEIAAPVMPPPGAGDASPRRVTFTKPESGEIYFTTDGSDPRQSGAGTVSPQATRFAEPIDVRAPGVLKARTLAGKSWSPLTEVVLR